MGDENKRPRSLSASRSPPPTPSLKIDKATFDELPQLHRVSSNSLPSPVSPISPTAPDNPKSPDDSKTAEPSQVVPKLRRTRTQRRSSSASATSTATLKQYQRDLLDDDAEEMASNPDIQKYAERNDGLQWGMGQLANECKWPAFPSAKRPKLEGAEVKADEEKKGSDGGEEKHDDMAEE